MDHPNSAGEIGRVGYLLSVANYWETVWPLSDWQSATVRPC